MPSPTITANKEAPSRLKYQNDAAITGSTNPTLAAMYTDLDAMMAVAGAYGSLIDLGEPGGPNDRSVRARLTVAMTDAEDETATEQLYIVTPCEIKGPSGTTSPVMLERIATLAWVAGTKPVVGGRTSEVLAKSVTLSNTGRLASLTGIEAVKAGADPEMVTIYDVGPATHLLRLIQRGTAATVSPLGTLWR
jgi:hypothetical protein